MSGTREMGYPVHPDGVETGVAGEYLQRALGCWIFGEDGLDILSK